MLRFALVCLASAALTLGILACGDDGGSSSPTPSDATPTETFGDGRTSPPTASLTDAPTSTGSDKTAPPSGNGDGEETPEPTAPGPTPTAPPTAAVGTPAPEVPPSIFADFEGRPITYKTCEYSLNTAQVTCEDAIYAIDPPIVGQDITCQLLFVEDVRELIQCTSVDPYNTIYYQIAE